MNPLAILSCCLLSSITVAQAYATPSRPAVIDLDSIAAVVNNDVITQTELNTRVSVITQRLAQQSIRLPPEGVLRKQILDRMILEQIQIQLAKRTGIRINDETVTAVINNMAKENGMALQEFRDVLAKDGFDFGQFRKGIKDEIIISRLRKQRVESRVSVTDQEVNNHLANLANRQTIDDEYHLGHILIAIPEAATPAQIQAAKTKAQKVLDELQADADFAQLAISNSDGQQALHGGDLGWRKGAQLPTLFAEVITNMSSGQISELIRSPSGFHVIKLLEKRSNKGKHIVNQTLARHILLRPNQLLSNDEARQRLQRLRERILAGEDFAQLANAHSDDKASAADGGSLGWSNPGQMVSRFEEEMGKLAPGDISKPFRSQFGWHIVQVMSRRTHDNTEEYQRIQARQLIGKRKMDEAVENWLRRLRDEAYVEYRLE